MFTHEEWGQAINAIEFWTGLFPNSETNALQKSPNESMNCWQ
jgi:predicted 3-demethylubiquinone-9 3-methyltransferase (glyoxalase superfamily)